MRVMQFELSQLFLVFSCLALLFLTLLCPVAILTPKLPTAIVGVEIVVTKKVTAMSLDLACTQIDISPGISMGLLALEST